MTYEDTGPQALDYFPCRYGQSKLLFRGPRRRLHGDYSVFLGGIETYGKFIETPFSTQVEHDTGLKSVNLGCVNAGVDAYLTDKSLVEICNNAKVTVIQLMGAQNMSNRFYAVHPRRNDRFLRPSKLMQTIFAEVDFADVNFTRHLLFTLSEGAPSKFSMVEQELKDAWVGRMTTLIKEINGPVILLWLADHAPGENPGLGEGNAEPLFVEREMLEQIRPLVSDIVEIVAEPDEIEEGMNEMVYAPLEQAAAEELLGPVVHRRAAAALAESIQALSMGISRDTMR